MLEGVVKRILTSNSKEFGVFLYKKKPPAILKVECTDFCVSPYKKHRFAILEAATNRDQTERRTLNRHWKAIAKMQQISANAEGNVTKFKT